MEGMMKRITLLLVAVLAPALLTTRLGSAEGKSPKANAAATGEDLFAQPKVYRMKIELSDSARDALRKEPRHYVKATIQEGSQVYQEVGVRLKGNTSFQTIDKKPALSIKFNEFARDHDFHGRSRVLLNNGLQDPTYLSEAIAGEIFRAAGVPAPKVTFARVELNGRDLGLYVMAEAVNHDFLSHYFKKAKGNLYEGVNSDVGDKLEKDSGNGSDDQADLRALASAAKEPDPTLRLKKLTPLLDIDRFLSFAAVEVMTWHNDGYSMDRNNYRIYHDPGSGQMVFLPHDLDQLFTKTDGPILPEWKGLVAKALLTPPTGQQLYLERMSKLLPTAFKVETLHARLNEMAGVVRPALAERDPNAVKPFDAALAQLRDRIAKRATFIEQQLRALSGAK